MDIREAVEFQKGYVDYEIKIDYETIPGYVIVAEYEDGELDLYVYKTEEFIAEVEKTIREGSEE